MGKHRLGFGWCWPTGSNLEAAGPDPASVSRLFPMASSSLDQVRGVDSSFRA